MIPAIIVEDEFLVRLGLKTAIDWEGEGFHIVGEAANGEEGLELFLKLRPKLVLTDIKMNKLDGISLMKEIRKIDSDVSFIVLSAYSDFDYAQQAIRLGVDNYILKGSVIDEELTQTLRQMSKRFKDIKSDLQQNCPNKNLNLAYFKENLTYIKDIEEFYDCKDIYAIASRLVRNEQSDITTSYFHLLENSVSQLQVPFIALEHKHFFFLLVNTTEPQAICEHIIKSTKRYLDKDCFMGISFKATKDDTVVALINQSKSACNRNVILQNNITEYEILKYDNHIITEQLINLFNLTLIDSNYTKCKEILEKIKKYIIGHKSSHIFDHILYQIVLTISRYDRSMTNKELFDILIYMDNINIIFNKINEIVQKLCDDVLPNFPQTSLHIDKALAYIQANICSNIKLRDVSDAIHISPNYLGRLFYDQTGMHMTQYIRKKKIAMACVLLKEGRSSVSNIAQTIGFSDQHYFSKLFREIMGISPTEYARTGSVSVLNS